jgi:hypothetical protein
VAEIEPRPGRAPIAARISLGDQLLRWSNSGAENTRTRISIPAGVSRRLDFVRVENGLAPPGQLPLVLDVWPQPANRQTWLSSGRLRVELVVTASNADAKRYTVMVGFDGKLPATDAATAGTIWDHLRIVPRAPA